MDKANAAVGKNARLVEDACRLLRELARQAESHSMFGTTAVEICWQNGVAQKVRRQFSDTVK